LCRRFYDDWWNSTSFAEFSRKWNLPVHEFLLRHVYLDAMRRRGLGPDAALYLTYLVSIAVHEIILWGAMGLVTPYLAVLSTAQFPLMSLLRLPAFRGKRLGNMLFWAGLMVGVTGLIVLYAREYGVK
jgi:sterol O-acyltransferase